MSVFDELTRDLDWREAELGSLKILLQKDDTSPIQKEVLLRAAWALLYAHYEGFCKFCLTKFYDEAAKRVPECKSLPHETMAYATSRRLAELRGLPLAEFLREVQNFTDYLEFTKPSFPEVDTKSNLWPNTLKGLLVDADILLDAIDKNAVKIKTLVARRNEIAHGQRNLIPEVDYYMTYEDAVYDVMYNLAYSIDERLANAPYN